MLKIHNPKLYMHTLLMYIEIFAIIFQSGTVASALKTDNTMFDVTRLIMVLLGGYFLVLGLKKCSAKVGSRIAILFLLMECLAIVNYILYPSSAMELQYKIALFVIFYFLSVFYNRKGGSLYEVLYKAILYIAVITLFLYIIISLLKLPIPYSTIYAPGTSAVYYRNYFDVFYSYSSGNIPRMCGLFWEPGVYQIYLNLGILLYILLNKKKKIQLLILVVSVLFAQSATGYMIMALLLGYMFIQSGWIAKHSRDLLGILVTVVVIAIVAYVLYIKKVTTDQVGDSYYLRALDIVNAISLFIKYPIFGVGFYNTEPFLLLNSLGRGNSNGYLTWLYTTGLVGQLFALFPFAYRIINSKIKYDKNRIILKFAFVFLINNSEPFYALPLNVFFIAQEYYLCFVAKNKNRRNDGGSIDVR